MTDKDIDYIIDRDNKLRKILIEIRALKDDNYYDGDYNEALDDAISIINKYFKIE